MYHIVYKHKLYEAEKETETERKLSQLFHNTDIDRDGQKKRQTETERKLSQLFHTDCNAKT